MFDLKSFREESLKLTQQELADLIDERQDKISRLEKNPVTIGLDILIKIADKTGTTLDELVRYKKKLPDPLKIEDTWAMAAVVRNRINDYLQDSLEREIANEKHRKMFEEIKELTGRSIIKPKVAVVGLSDTGKSTLINGLLGAEKMPTAWTPTTAISIYINM
jgi:ribosome biogenesis GTPase A